MQGDTAEIQRHACGRQFYLWFISAGWPWIKAVALFAFDMYNKERTLAFFV